MNPTGKLAVTFPRSDADLPHPTLVMPPKESQIDFDAIDFADVSNMMSQAFKSLPPFQVQYDEGLKVGYAWYQAEKKSVLFPFGFGLSYTDYRYSDLKVVPGQQHTGHVYGHKHREARRYRGRTNRRAAWLAGRG